MDAPPPFERRDRRRPHRTAPWVRNGLMLLVAFLLWLVMDAGVLQHNAQVIGSGTRRQVALDVLGPIAAFARLTGADLPAVGANEALGRTGVGGFVIPTVPTTTTIPGTTTTSTTIPFHFTRRHPLRVLLIGDSIGEDLDAPLLAELDQSGVVDVFTDDHIDTGLTRLDYFNWIAELAYDVYHDRPQVVVGMMGANDDQNFSNGLVYPTAPWRAKYLANVSKLFTIGTSGGRLMFWVSVPLMSAPGWQPIRQIQQLAARRHHVVYVDSNLTLCPGGRFHMFLRLGGVITQIRVSDGIHLTPAGAGLLANSVVHVMERRLHAHL